MKSDFLKVLVFALICIPVLRNIDIAKNGTGGTHRAISMGVNRLIPKGR